ncbi:MAG: putative U2 small nuclear ribonucleoprotein A [Streblomastix strix]|uniref:Putative U2 small nuclear ribonucleoprotein A n=1 Tax=Streblomastix strix TaxID=222440 RepID=A0A5J4X9E7_9EUKA|nr:MAG: putative U2 small nuclear ribonucleoprotein A [Streblomastix strix]
MRLTVELLQQLESFFNPCGEHQVNIRGLNIPAIENFGTLKDAYDAVDLTDNAIQILGGFPCSHRLKTLLLANNRISQIQPTLSEQLPRLETLILTKNNIDNLNELSHLAGIPILRLDVTENRVSQLPDYRLFVIHMLPTLKILDFQKVTQKEKEESVKRFGVIAQESSQSSDVKQSETRVIDATNKLETTFSPGEVPPAAFHPSKK